MPRRIDVTPKSDGTIELLCGDEELVLVLPGARSPSPAPRSARAKVDINRIYTYSMPHLGGLQSLDLLVQKIASEHEDSETPPIHQVMVSSPALDVHAIADLAKRLHVRVPDIGLHVNLLSRKPFR